MNISPSKNIFFVVSKLDGSKKECSSTSSDESEDEQEKAAWEENCKQQERKILQTVRLVTGRDNICFSDLLHDIKVIV